MIFSCGHVPTLKQCQLPTTRVTSLGPDFQKVVSLVSTLMSKNMWDQNTIYYKKEHNPSLQTSTPRLFFQKKSTYIVHQIENVEPNSKRAAHVLVDVKHSEIFSLMYLEGTLCPRISLLEKRKYFTLCLLLGRTSFPFLSSYTQGVSIRPISSSTCV